MTSTQPVIPAHVIPDPTPQGIPSFIQMQQQKDLNNAMDNLSGADSKEDGKKKDFSDLMPKWMYALGETYNEEEKIDGYSGPVGKYLAQISSMQVLQQSFAKLMTSADSFTGLKDYIVKYKDQYSQQMDGVGSAATALYNMSVYFDPTVDGDAQSEAQVQSLEQGMLNGMQQTANSLSQESQMGNSFIKRIQNQTMDAKSDGQQVSQLVGQIAGGFYHDFC